MSINGTEGNCRHADKSLVAVAHFSDHVPCAPIQLGFPLSASFVLTTTSQRAAGNDQGSPDESCRKQLESYSHWKPLLL